MAFVIKNEFISKELEKEIATAIKERRSVAQLLTEKKFVGTAESIEELAHVLILYMGADMAIEFIFSASLSEWEKYRGLLADLWEKISVSEQFKAKTDLILGQSLYQQGLKELGTNFIKRAGINADNVKTAVDVAQVISHEIGNNAWIKEILLGAKDIAKSCDDYANIAKAFFVLTNDEKECRKTFEKAISMANSFSEFCLIASSILKSSLDRELAKKVFKQGLKKKNPNSPLDNAAEEEYKKILRKSR